MLQVIGIRHVAFETLGLVGSLLAARGARITYLEAPTDDLTPALDADLTVILGGPISANATADYPFLMREIQIAQTRLNGGQPVLGICLGAQIMARALGCPVYGGPAPEIGWHPLTLTQEGAEGLLGPLERRPVLHWHGETFDLPAGAVRLASTQICPNQAFAWGRHGLALQFHLEVEAQGLEPWLVGHTLEIDKTPGISVQSLREETARLGPGLANAAASVFEAWFDQVLPQQ